MSADYGILHIACAIDTLPVESIVNDDLMHLRYNTCGFSLLDVPRSILPTPPDTDSPTSISDGAILLSSSVIIDLPILKQGYISCSLFTEELRPNYPESKTPTDATVHFLNGGGFRKICVNH